MFGNGDTFVLKNRKAVLVYLQV